ncbi:integrase, catalytic region, zinc finger, CCHC-type containing protein [Tanacetum coccineum]
MANLSEDIQCAGSDTRPPMLDRTDFASWQQRIRLYCRGKENGVNILKSIDEGPFQMGTIRDPIAEGTEDAPGRFVTTMKLNRGLRDSNYDQLYSYLKNHEAHTNEKKMMLDRFTQHTVDPLALMSNVSQQQYYLQSSTTPPSTHLQPHFADNTSGPVPQRKESIRLVQNGCSFHGLRSEDPNQHLKDFLKLVELDFGGDNRERTRLHLFQFSLSDQASNWLERLPAGSITTWEDLTTRFLAQFFPLRRTAKLCNDILMFQQHHEESLSKA